MECLAEVKDFLDKLADWTYAEAAKQQSDRNAAIQQTLELIAAAPIFAAVFSIFILKEIPNIFTWVIIFISLGGMIIIGWGSYTSSGIFGDLMALIVATGMGLGMVIVRFYKEKDFVPACLIGCVLATLYVLPFNIDFNLNIYQIYFLKHSRVHQMKSPLVVFSVKHFDFLIVS